jgi:UDP-N-acetylmuramate dehydrogenase
MFLKNVSLKNYNTFGIEVSCKYYAEFSEVEELYAIIKSNIFKENSLLVLGGGSNILLTKNFDGLVLRNNIKGIELVKEEAEFVYVKGMAGEVWHNFVMYCVEKNWGGIENLSLIPGCVGAAPMQNIGAYGVEIKDTFHELEAIDIITCERRVFNNTECEFGYRESVFKNKYKGQFIIVSVTFKLSKKPLFNTAYGAIEQELKNTGVSKLTIKAISEAVIRIRKSKLPDPAKIGNAGSFFKNPLVSNQLYNQIKTNYPSVVAYPNGSQIKLAAGWLIENCGWKGFRERDYGVHALQSLVLVNYSNATGKEIYNLSERILQSVKEKFGVILEREVNIF